MQPTHLNYGLNPTDRRMISGMHNWENMTFALRKNVILMQLDALRCLLLFDRMIVLAPDGATELLNELETKVLEARRQQSQHIGNYVPILYTERKPLLSYQLLEFIDIYLDLFLRLCRKRGRSFDPFRTTCC